ncbi:SitI3 family protein [Archangium lansingense]|uniref:SitI3 family protein n=1 Tax=Archangium lansingense TaxID=2995310 RepID=UPI003B80701E
MREAHQLGLDYALSLCTDELPAEALDLLANRLELEWVDASRLSGTAIGLTVREPSRDWQAMIKEGFHFTPDLLVLFRIHPDGEGHEQALRLMLRAAQFLLERGRDAVLLFNGEHIILQRFQGQLVLNADYGDWTDGFRLVDEIWLSHEWRSLPSLPL